MALSERAVSYHEMPAKPSHLNGGFCGIIQVRRQVFKGGGQIVVGGLDPRYERGGGGGGGGAVCFRPDTKSGGGRGGGVLSASGPIRKAGGGGGGGCCTLQAQYERPWGGGGGCLAVSGRGGGTLYERATL